MTSTCGEAIGIAVESSQSVGWAVVDSMAARRIKAFASHAQAFREPPRVYCASARITGFRPLRITGFRRVSADNPAAVRTGGWSRPPRGAGALPASYEPRSAHAPTEPAAGREKTVRKSRKTRSGTD